MLGISGWMGLGLAIYSVAATLLTFWLAARLWGRGQAPPLWAPWTVVGNLVWSALLFLASVIAVRYIERVPYQILGYAAYALGGVLLSLARASLRVRASRAGATEDRTHRPWLSRADVVHNLAYLLWALVLLLLLSWLGGSSVPPLMLLPLFAGALLPDLDDPDSLLGRLLPALSRGLAGRLGHRQAWHTPAAAIVVALLTMPLALFLSSGLAASYVLGLGFLAHLLFDLLTPQGIMLLWPFSHRRFHVPRPPIRSHGSVAERRLVLGLAAAALVLLVLVGLGPEPPPPAAPPPSYQQTLERYHGLRGRYLVFAQVQGTWQTSGLRLSGRFEVLNALGSSYVLLDRYTGKVFTAGRSPDDHVYLDSISLQTGSQVQIKPVEINLQDETLAEALSILYEMQAEPGLEYIYVFGDVVLAAGASLPADPGLTAVPRIEAQAPGRYRFQYLTADRLVALAWVEVETANLLVVASYTSPPAGPTATPLPPPPAAPEAAP